MAENDKVELELDIDDAKARAKLDKFRADTKKPIKTVADAEVKAKAAAIEREHKRLESLDRKRQAAGEAHSKKMDRLAYQAQVRTGGAEGKVGVGRGALGREAKAALDAARKSQPKMPDLRIPDQSPKFPRGQAPGVNVPLEMGPNTANKAGGWMAGPARQVGFPGWKKNWPDPLRPFGSGRPESQGPSLSSLPGDRQSRKEKERDNKELLEFGKNLSKGGKGLNETAKAAGGAGKGLGGLGHILGGFGEHGGMMRALASGGMGPGGAGAIAAFAVVTKGLEVTGKGLERLTDVMRKIHEYGRAGADKLNPRGAATREGSKDLFDMSVGRPYLMFQRAESNLFQEGANMVSRANASREKFLQSTGLAWNDPKGGLGGFVRKFIPVGASLQDLVNKQPNLQAGFGEAQTFGNGAEFHAAMTREGLSGGPLEKAAEIQRMRESLDMMRGEKFDNPNLVSNDDAVKQWAAALENVAAGFVNSFPEVMAAKLVAAWWGK